MPTTDVYATKALARDLDEDIATQWIPDVLGNFDFEAGLAHPRITQNDIQFVDVPKGGEETRTVPILGAPVLRALRDAVAPLREVSESLLDPMVCGYRTGATDGNSYSDEYSRFRQISQAFASEYKFVIIADVKSFFASVEAGTVSAAMTRVMGRQVWLPVESFLDCVSRLGVRGLPAGYGDVRLVANHVLSVPDSALGTPFTRWVDDYRIFAQTLADADDALNRLSKSLKELGFELNHRKVEVLSREEYLARRHGAPLESVYHPGLESPSVVRANLRSVFIKAANDGNRRLLRFALPRLGDQGDEIAIDYALNELSRNSIDSPRLVYYLSRFINDVKVQQQVEQLVTLGVLKPWSFLRLSALLYRFDLSNSSIDALDSTLKCTTIPAVWAAALRVLAVHGHTDRVVGEIRRRDCLPDVRAVIGAMTDVGEAVPDDCLRLAPETASEAALSGGVPIPSPYTLL